MFNTRELLLQNGYGKDMYGQRGGRQHVIAATGEDAITSVRATCRHAQRYVDGIMTPAEVESS